MFIKIPSKRDNHPRILNPSMAPSTTVQQQFNSHQPSHFLSTVQQVSPGSFMFTPFFKTINYASARFAQQSVILRKKLPHFWFYGSQSVTNDSPRAGYDREPIRLPTTSPLTHLLLWWQLVERAFIRLDLLTISRKLSASCQIKMHTCKTRGERKKTHISTFNDVATITEEMGVFYDFA